MTFMQPPMDFDPKILRGRIIFVSNRDGPHEIYTMNADGSDMIRLPIGASNPQRAWLGMPAWSPDKKRITFSTQGGGEEAAIHVMDADGSNVTTLARGGRIYGASWSPDGELLAYTSWDPTGVEQVFVMNSDGSNARQLTHGYKERTSIIDQVLKSQQNVLIQTGQLSRAFPLSGFSRNPRWSPDGKSIAFTSGRTRVQDIYLMNADGSNQRRLALSKSASDWPCWSPDGLQIAFANNGISIINADGSNRRDLFDEHGSVRAPKWSPDGNYLLYTGRIGADLQTSPRNMGRDGLFVIDVHSLKRITLSNDRCDDTAGDWHA